MQPLADLRATLDKAVAALANGGTPSTRPSLERPKVAELREDEAVERRIPARAHVILLDPRGRQLDSESFAGWLEERRRAGLDLCFVVGGPFGIELPRADLRLSLGPMTLPHLLARVVLLEQLFRAHKIIAGEAYHH